MQRTLQMEERTPLGSESALWLLDRSIRFGHGRLAVIRLYMAVSVGADIGPDHWTFCRRIAESSSDRMVQQLYLDASSKAVGPSARAMEPEPSTDGPGVSAGR